MTPAAMTVKQPVPDPRQAGSGMRLLLWEIQSPINFGMLLRVAETYRVPVGALGSNRVFGDAGHNAIVSDFACGALTRRGFTALADPAAADAWRGGARLVATSIDRDAVALSEFRFQPGDVVVLGNEYDGLPDEVVAAADQKIVIPMAQVWTPKPRSVSPIDPARVAPVTRDGEPNLNVAVAGAIICYAAYVQAVAERSADQGVLA